MPIYEYKCENDHHMTMIHRMLYGTAIVCTTCDESMWRVPQEVNVTWGGLAPSQGEYSPEIQAHLATVDQQRDEYLAEHERHERQTEMEDGKA